MTASHTSPNSLSFKPLSLYYFSEQSYRKSFNFQNQHFTIIHLIECHNRNKFFLLGPCYHKEMAFNGAGFTLRKWGDSHLHVHTHLFLCVSIEQAVIRRKSCRSWNGTYCNFFVAMINLYRTNAPDPFKSASYKRTKWVRCGHLNPPHSLVQA